MFVKASSAIWASPAGEPLDQLAIHGLCVPSDTVAVREVHLHQRQHIVLAHAVRHAPIADSALQQACSGRHGIEVVPPSVCAQQVLDGRSELGDTDWLRKVGRAIHSVEELPRPLGFVVVPIGHVAAVLDAELLALSLAHALPQPREEQPHVVADLLGGITLAIDAEQAGSEIVGLILAQILEEFGNLSRPLGRELAGSSH